MLYNIANPHGGDIYGEEKIELDYSANTNPYGTPEGVRRAITESLGSLDRYPDAECRRLLRALAGHEGVPRDYLICGNGAAEVIYAYCEAVGARAPWAAAQSSPNPLSEAAASPAAQSSPNPLPEAAASPAAPETLRAAASPAAPETLRAAAFPAAQSSPNPLSKAAASTAAPETLRTAAFPAAQSSPNPLSEAAAFPAAPEALRAAAFPAAQSSPNPLSEAAASPAAQSSPNPLSEAAASPAAPEALCAAELAPTFAEYSLAFLRSQADCNPTSGNAQNAHFGKDTQKIIRYPLKKENGFAPDAGLLSFIEKEQPHVLFLCHPNNPTGIPFEEGLLREIIALCGKLSIRIFLDECFLDLTSGIWDAKEMLAENPHLFILKAFTKSYGMAGVRLGFGMTADTALLEKMSRAVQPWNVSTPAQAAGIAALQEKEFLQKTVALIEKERPYLKSELEKMGYYTTDSVTNYILFEAEKDLAKELKKQGIAIRECENYQGLDAGWYRIAVRTHEENEKLIAAIRKVREK